MSCYKLGFFSCLFDIRSASNCLNSLSLGYPPIARVQARGNRQHAQHQQTCHPDLVARSIYPCKCEYAFRRRRYQLEGSHLSVACLVCCSQTTIAFAQTYRRPTLCVDQTASNAMYRQAAFSGLDCGCPRQEPERPLLHMLAVSIHMRGFPIHFTLFYICIPIHIASSMLG